MGIYDFNAAVKPISLRDLNAQYLQDQKSRQEVQSGNIQLQEQQQQLADRKAMTTAMHEWDGKNMEDLPGLMLKHGASANAVMSTKQGVIAQQKAFSDKTKIDLENDKVKHDYLAQQIDNVLTLPPEQQAQALEAAKADAVQRGYMSPQDAQALHYQTPDQLKLVQKGLLGYSNAVDMAAKAAGTQKDVAQAGQAAAATNKINAEINPNNPADPNIARQKYQGILQKIQTQGLAALTPEELTWAKSHEASERKTTTQSDTLGVTSTSTNGPAGLATVGAGKRPASSPQSTAPGAPAPGVGLSAPPKQFLSQSPAQMKEAIVDEIGNYKTNPTILTRLMTKHPEIMAMVQQKYPDWNQPDYNALNKMVTAYTSGPQSKQINASNVALHHLGLLDQAADAMNNGSIPVLNKLANAVGVQLGQTPVTTFQNIVHKLGPELAAAYIQGGGGEGERAGIQKDFDPSLGAAQIKSNIATTAKLFEPNVESLEQQYKNTTKRDDFRQRFLTPGASQVLNSLASKAPVGNSQQVKNPYR